MADTLTIGVVGPCAAGKSTLIENLRKAGIPARHIAQEHSYVQDMWLRLTHPQVLVYLDVSYPTSKERRKLDWMEAEYREQCRRLAHAREHATIYVDTDPLDSCQVFEIVLGELTRLVPPGQAKFG